MDKFLKRYNLPNLTNVNNPVFFSEIEFVIQNIPKYKLKAPMTSVENTTRILKKEIIPAPSSGSAGWSTVPYTTACGLMPAHA